MPGARTSSCATRDSGEVWSAGYQPSGVEPDSYEATFLEDRVEIVRRDGTITTTLEVAVSPEDDAEVASRHRSRTADSRAREIERDVVCRGRAGARRGRRGASGLLQAVRADGVRRRRRRAPGHAAAPVTRRAARSGRPTSPSSKARRSVAHNSKPTGRAFSDAGAAFARRSRSSTAGRSPTRPAPCSIRSSACAAASGFRRGPPRASRSGRWSRPRAAKCSTWPTSITTPAAFERAVTLAWTQAQVQLYPPRHRLRRGHLFQRLASHVLYSNPALRPSSDVLTRSEGGPSALWAHGISGDLPIVLVPDRRRRGSGDRPPAAPRPRVLADEAAGVDLVILNEQAASYAQDLQAALEALVRASQSRRPSGGATAPGERVRPARRPGLGRGAERCSRASRERCSSAAAGASSSRSNAWRNRSRCRSRRPASRAPANDVPPPAAGAARTRVLQRPRRLRDRRTRIRDDPRRGAVDAGALDQRDRQSLLRLPGLGRRRGLYLVDQQSARTSSRPGRTTRSSDRPGEVIYVRDEDSGALWRPTALPIREEALALRRPPRPGLQPVRAHLARHLARAAAVRAAGRPDQDLAAEDHAISRADRAVSRSPRTWSGCSALPAPRPRRSS